LFALVFVGYAAGAEVAFRLADMSDLNAVFFVPAGITLGALLRSDRRLWPWVLAAAAAGEILQDLRVGLGTAEALGFAAANVVEPLLAAIAIERLVGAPLDLSYRKHVGWFLTCGVAGAPAVGALIGATVGRAAGNDDFSATFMQWWLGDALGVLLVATLILVWQGGAPGRASLASPWGAALLLASVGGTVLVMAATDLPLLFVVLTGVVVAAAQFGVRAVAVTSAAVAVTIAVCLLFEHDPLLTGVSQADAVIVFKLKLLVFSTGGLVVAAEVFERVRMTEAAAASRAEVAAERVLVGRLQHLLLPPEQAGGTHFDAYGSYLAGAASLGVGGDWYDVAGLPDGRVFMAVGDVVGHGERAAAVMARLRAAMFVSAPQAADAGELLSMLDAHTDRIVESFGTTVWAGMYDPASQCLTFASAGHPPGYLIAPGRRPTRLAHPVATPLGVTPGEPKPSARLTLAGPATIVLYTDGLIERRGETLDVGLTRLERRLRFATHVATRPQRVVETLRPRTHDDDTVILAVTLRPARVQAAPHGVPGAHV